MFNFFRKKETPAAVSFRCITYASATAKHKALVGEAKKDPGTLFIYWFAETGNELKRLFEANQVDTAGLMDAHFVRSGMLQQKKIIFTELYPLHEKEISLTAGWPPQELPVYISLDEPFFKQFGGEKILGLLLKMGMKEEEQLAHPLISQSIINAQQKIAKKINFEQPARSQSEWMQKNIK